MIQEIMRLRSLGLSKRMITKALGCSRNTVDKYLAAETEVAPASSRPLYHAPWSDQIDWPAVHAATLKGDPLRAWWEERISPSQDLQSIPYVSFWREYRRRFPSIPLDLHKVHPPGERCEFDYKGADAGFGYVDRATGEFVPCRLFGAVLCFSQLFFPRATLTEKQEDLLRSIAEAFAYFGGIPHTSAVDNTKAAVNRAHRYDPDIHKEFAHFCTHYQTAPLAMRPGKPKDKNLIENALGVFWRWARRHLREKTFYSLGELNAFLKALADDFNERLQRKYGVSRRQKFEAGEREKLLPLPLHGYDYGQWKKAKVHPDCHIQVEKNFYSVPHVLRGRDIDVRITPSIVEAYSDLDCVARHLRANPHSIGQYFTKDSHLPESHRALREATPLNAIEEASRIGPATEELVRTLFEQARHPLMHLRRVQGILRLEKRYSKAELERAAERLLTIGTRLPRLGDVEGLIKNAKNPTLAPVIPIRRHPNPFLRGQDTWRSPLGD